MLDLVKKKKKSNLCTNCFVFWHEALFYYTKQENEIIKIKKRKKKYVLKIDEKNIRSFIFSSGIIL